MRKYILQILILLLVVYTTACEQADEQDTLVTVARSNRFVDNQQCLDCHQDQADLWAGSHHDLAMQVASVDTVLGDFNDSEFTHPCVAS